MVHGGTNPLRPAVLLGERLSSKHSRQLGREVFAGLGFQSPLFDREGFFHLLHEMKQALYIRFN
jgi:hypothetical protein